MGHKKLVLSDVAADYPEFLKNAANNYRPALSDVPTIIYANTATGAKQLEVVLNTNPKAVIIDNYAEQYAELLLSKNAHLYRAKYEIQVASIAELLDEHYAGQPAWQKGAWVFFPWSEQIVHVLDQFDFEALRTIRNRDLISAELAELCRYLG